MRTREEMLKDANTARRSYAMLTEPEDMMLVRLGWDVTELLAALAEKDAEIEALNERNEVNEITLQARQIRLELAQERVVEMDDEIALWKTADSKAVAAARKETAKLWEVLEGAWYQFAYTGTKGERWCGGLSALEDIADALGLDV